MQQPRRRHSDDYSNKPEHEKTTGEHQTGGHAGAGKSGAEGLGTERETRDERFGSHKPQKHKKA